MSAGFSYDRGALTADERERHRELVNELLAAVFSRTELTSGYSFGIAAAKMPWMHFAERVGLENRRCPFFDFRLSQARNGGAMTLALTGDAGNKSLSKRGC